MSVRNPAKEARAGAPRAAARGPSGISPFLIYAALVLAILLGAVLMYTRQQAKVVGATEAQLARIAEVKRDELAAWVRERVREAEIIAGLPAIMSVLREGDGALASDAEQQTARETLERIAVQPPYESVFLVDSAGQLRMTAGAPPLSDEPLGPVVMDALHLRAATLSDFFLPIERYKVRLVLAVPLVGGDGQVAGAMVLRINPYATLFQPLSRWPAPSRTVELLLLDRQHHHMVRMRPGAAPDERVRSFAREQMSEVMLRALERPRESALLEGRDYREVEVIAAVKPVPNTPWLLEVKVDRDEALATLRETAIVITATSTLLVAATGLVAGSWWRKERALFLVERYSAALQREALARHFDYLARYGNDIVLLMDRSWAIIEVNDRAAEAFRATAGELRRLHWADLAENPDAAQAALERLEGEEGVRFETKHLRRDGSSFSAEVSARRLEIEERPFIQAIIRDITERKEWEFRLQRANHLYAALSQTNEAIVRLRDETELFQQVCRIVVEEGHFQGAWIALVGTDGTALEARAQFGIGGKEVPGDRVPLDSGYSEGQGLAATAFRENRVKISNDYQTDPRTVHWRAAAVRSGLRSGAALPLRSGGVPVGVLAVFAGERGFFDEELIALLQEMALDISFALENLERERQRREVASALRESEFRYRQLVNNMGSSVVVADVADDGGRIVISDINQAMERMEGLARDEVIGRDWTEVFPGAKASGIIDAMARVWRGGHPEFFPAVFYRDPKRSGWREGYIYRLPTGEVVGVYDNVTARKEAELAMQRSEERLRYALQGSTDGFWDYDMDAGHIYFSDRYADILGFRHQDLDPTPRTFEMLIHPDDIGRVWGELHAHVEGHTAQFVSEHRMLSKLGEWKWVLVRGRVVGRDARGAATRMCGTSSDITERKRTDEQLRLWATVFENSSEAIFIADQDRRILAVNRAFVKITGYPPEEVIGREPVSLSPHPEERAILERVWGMIAATGHWQGELRDRRKDGELYSKWLAVTSVRDPAGVTRNHIGIFSDITERKSAEEQIRFLAQHDLLTGLPNRTLMQDRVTQALAHARRTGSRVALLVVDIDRFKHINESLGLEWGDLLLRRVADRLQACVRDEDTVSRQGGDEFVVVLADTKDATDAAHTGQKMLDTLSEPYLLGDQVTAHITASVGIALSPEDGEDTETLVKNAGAAMYYAKEHGRGNFQFFVGDINARALHRISVENQLRRALERNEFVLFYQPQVDADSGEVVGAEALIRWKIEGGGFIPPADFIPIAEESGLIVPIGDWVLQEACRQLSAWIEPGAPSIPISVNISPVQFHHKDFRRSVGRILGSCELRPGRLEVELTESMLMQAEEAEHALEDLKSMGLMLALDDFGTGYSSLSYLRRFPIDRLKVDQSFIRDMERDATDLAITESIIALGRNLGLRVVAEGVETEGAYRLLRELGCGDIQGFFFSPPLPADQLAEWMRVREEARTHA